MRTIEDIYTLMLKCHKFNILFKANNVLQQLWQMIVNGSTEVIKDFKELMQR